MKHISISTRISILLGLIIVITMGVFSAVSLMKQQKDSVDSLSRSTLLLSRTTERILRLSMLKNRREEISMAIRNIVGEEGIQSVRILNHEGIIEFSSRKTEIHEHISRTNHLCTNCHTANGDSSIRPVSSFYSHHFDETHDVIYSSLPIYNSPSCYNGDCHVNDSQQAYVTMGKSEAALNPHPVHDSSQTILGFIEIEVSAKKIMSDLDRSRTELILLTIMIALAASIVAYFSIRRLVGNPVKKLVEGTHRVAQGDFSHEIHSGEAELGVLADSFNQMQRQLLSAQSQLIESEKLASVGKLADGIANEISNPLTGIIIYAESLIAQSVLGEREKADCETILQEALKIRESIRNILSLAKKEKPRLVPVDIDKTIRHAVSVLEKLSDFRNIRVIVSIPKDVPHIPADPGMLEQVFLNLLMVSSEDLATGGILNINAVNMPNEAKIEIRFAHSGGGIPENILRELTNQNAGQGAENIGRTRISLTVCREIVALHKGSIYSSSEPGTAASIIIELPA